MKCIRQQIYIQPQVSASGGKNPKMQTSTSIVSKQQNSPLDAFMYIKFFAEEEQTRRQQQHPNVLHANYRIRA